MSENKGANDTVINVPVEHELQQSYISYSMSVIIGRALPDVRDGLKPVHRRVMYAMHELRNDFNKPYKKSARIVGDVIGKYHPHGDTAVYDAIVRMAQPFAMRYVLIDGQGNFGSVDGDSAAAMRYTEVRMAKLAHYLLSDIDKETVDFTPNYDNSEMCPDVLPTRFPNVLINGTSGIAVGMATNIPPHHFGEIMNACLHLIDHPDADVEALMAHVKGPDFPTYGIISGRSGIVDAYKTGRGKIYIKSKTHIETIKKSGRQAIIVSELPYQVNKARLQEKIAELVKEKRIDGIMAIRDESDRKGMRVVIEVRRGENPEILLNQLTAMTQLQVVYGINMVVLHQGKPICMPLKSMLNAFIEHRCVVVTRRSIYELAKARSRVHILESLMIALANIDDMIALIKASESSAKAKVALMARTWDPSDLQVLLKAAGNVDTSPRDIVDVFGVGPNGYQLSSVQAQAILDMKLHRLTGLEREKITEEFKQIVDQIHNLEQILTRHDVLLGVIKTEMQEIKGWFNDERRSQIIDQHQSLDDIDLIDDKTIVVTLSNVGYIKLQDVDTYQTQHRGGKGKSSASIKEDDYIDSLCIARTKDTLLMFTNKGRLYWQQAYKLPMASRASRGRPINNFIPLQDGEKVTAILNVRQYNKDAHVFMATRQGVVKKVDLSLFSRQRSSGIIAIDLRDDDELIGVEITSGEDDIMLFSSSGKAIRFKENEVRSMGRAARGVRGMRLGADHHLISMIVANNDRRVLTVTTNGFGKQTKVSLFRMTARGGQGVIAMNTTQQTGALIAALQVDDDQDLLLITNKGTMVRTRVNEISVLSRNTKGVKVISLASDEKLIASQCFMNLNNDDKPQ